MKVQQSAKVQMAELKSKALENRHNLQYNRKGGVDEQVVQNLVQEYEAKIEHLESELRDNALQRQLKEQVNSLELERDRLIQALEYSSDRTFFTKFLYNKQK